MNLSCIFQKLQRLQALFLAAILVICLSLTIGSPAALSANNTPEIDRKLKEQVLQIIHDNPEAILESVRDYQLEQQNQLRLARESFLDGVKNNPKTAIAESPVVGSPTQEILLLEFSDFQCQFCAQAHKTISQFMAKHQDQVTLVYKHLPLVAIHPQSLPAAQAAWAAQQQGKFWEYHNALFDAQQDLNEELYIAIAKNLNLDLDRFNSDRNSSAARAAIQKDMELALKLGIEGTPFFILEGETFSGVLELAEMENILAKVSS
ncbi:disulfide bond formation protein DsbA [Oscillatoriales cyanobacterium USR001]|nr:disulfide bond formation protein DsbA [Oscillatoriales cyanobacterium USR001]